MKYTHLFLACAIALGAASARAESPAPAAAQLPDFMYQGKLEKSGNPANGTFDMTFSLWDAPAAGTRLGSVISEPAYPISNGLFNINLAFIGAFTGSQTYLEVTVDGVALPRQPLTTAPVAQFALNGTVGPMGPAGSAGPQGIAGSAARPVSRRRGAIGPAGHKVPCPDGARSGRCAGSCGC